MSTPYTAQDKLAAEARLISVLSGYHEKLNRHQMASVQHDLNILGLKSGKEDGIPGPITGGAVAAFLTTHPELDQDTLNPSVARGLTMHRAKLVADKHVPESIKKPATVNHPVPAAPEAETNQSPTNHTGYERTKIVLDFGHGTPNSKGVIDRGAEAQSKHGKIYESDINEAVGIKLKAILEARGYDVTVAQRDKAAVLGTGKPQPFYQRTHTAPDAAAFVSLHCDIRDKADMRWKGKDTNGIKVHVHESEQHDGKTSLAEQFANHLHTDSKSSQSLDSNSYRSYFVLRPGMHGGEEKRPLRALVEMGAMNNPKELEKLVSQTGQMEIANQIADALAETYPPKNPPMKYTVPTEITMNNMAPPSTTAVHRPIGPKISK